MLKYPIWILKKKLSNKISDFVKTLCDILMKNWSAVFLVKMGGIWGGIRAISSYPTALFFTAVSVQTVLGMFQDSMAQQNSKLCKHKLFKPNLKWPKKIFLLNDIFQCCFCV